MAEDDYVRLRVGFRLPQIPTKERAPHRRLNVRQSVCAAPGCERQYEQWLPHERYCSDACYRTVNIERMRARQQGARDRNARNCAGCAVSFVPAYNDKRRTFCSAECRKKHQYATRPGSTHRRRAKRYGVAYESINKWDVFARDGWRCQLCGVKTPRKFSGMKRDDAPHLDHITPLAAGGDHVYSNVQCACRRCNLVKSDRPLGQMRIF